MHFSATLHSFKKSAEQITGLKWHFQDLSVCYSQFDPMQTQGVRKSGVTEKPAIVVIAQRSQKVARVFLLKF